MTTKKNHRLTRIQTMTNQTTATSSVPPFGPLVTVGDSTYRLSSIVRSMIPSIRDSVLDALVPAPAQDIVNVYCVMHLAETGFPFAPSQVSVQPD